MEKELSRRQKQGVKYLHGEYNCCRSTLLPFIELTGVDEDTLKRLAGPFGAGIGRMRETCGTVNGMAMIVGLIFGTADVLDAASKEKQYEIVQSAAEKFKSRHGSLLCRDLLGLDEETLNVPSNDLPQYKNGNICDACVADMISIIEEKLVEFGIEKAEEQ